MSEINVIGSLIWYIFLFLSECGVFLIPFNPTNLDKFKNLAKTTVTITLCMTKLSIYKRNLLGWWAVPLIQLVGLKWELWFCHKLLPLKTKRKIGFQESPTPPPRQRVLTSGVSILRYINISIKYSNFSGFYKKLGPFYKKLKCDKFGDWSIF